MSLSDEFTLRTSHYLIASATVVTMLSWRDTFESVINYIYPLERDAVSAKVIYSAVLTAIVILLIYYLPNTEEVLPPKTKKEINDKRIERIVQSRLAVINNRALNY